MSQRDAVLRQQIAGLARETTPGTHPGSVTRIALVGGAPLLTKATQEMVAVPTDSPLRTDNPAHIAGKTVAEWQATIQMRGILSADRLVAAATPAELSHDLLLEHGFGRRTAVVGTTVTGSGSTVSTVDCTSVTGMKAGMIVLVGSSPRRITSIASTTLTVAPALGGIPATSTVVRGTRTFVLADARNKHLSIEQRMVDMASGTHTEERVLGAFGTMSMSFPAVGQIPTIAFKGQAISYQGPATLSSPSWSLGVSPADDDMGDPLCWYPKVYVDGTAYTIEPGSLKINVAQNITPVGNGAVRSGINSFLDTSGRDNGMAVSGEFVIRIDHSEATSTFDSGTIRHLLVHCDPDDDVSTVTTSVAIEIPRFQVTERPVRVDAGGGRAGYKIAFKALRDTLTPASATTAEDRDLAYTPIRYAII